MSPEDKNGDGISGKANYIFSESKGFQSIGRFGWKANEPTLHDQVAAAFLGDMGLASSLFPKENCSEFQTVCEEHINGGTPEVEDKQMDLVVHYSQLIAVPARRNTEDSNVRKGRELFMDMGCASCHRPSMKTSSTAWHTLLQDQVIWPYTDLLLHDMGEGLADNRPDGLANGQEWRTAPLWGIGLNAAVNKNEFYLHDGRARSFEEAILWHGGEAQVVRDRYSNASKEEREQIQAFLKSL